jgi:alkylation response protein AidB-like acyl-CoA dehydrogenase
MEKFGIWAFESLQKLGGLNLDLFYTVIFLEELIKSSGLLLRCGHSYLAMTHLNAEGDERIKQDYLAKYCW